MDRAKLTLERISDLRNGNGFGLFIEMPNSEGVKRLESFIKVMNIDGHYIVSEGNKPFAVKHVLTQALDAAYKRIMETVPRFRHEEDDFEDVAKYTLSVEPPRRQIISPAEIAASSYSYNELVQSL